VPTVVSPSRVTSTEASHASLAVTVGQIATAGQSIVTLAAQVMAGAVMSLTDTERLQVDVLPQSSVAR
jgi:hypothetical protein